jgi:hypothetical protein
MISVCAKMSMILNLGRSRRSRIGGQKSANETDYSPYDYKCYSPYDYKCY